MGYLEIPEGHDFITPLQLRKRYGKYDPNVFKRWQEQGKVEKIRNGLYLSSSFEHYSEVDTFKIANRLYEPSYISLLTALSHYGFIPEYVVEFQSISTRKSNKFLYGRDRFSYHKVKPELFFGYTEYHIRGGKYRLAKPEKALLDLAYLEPQFSDSAWLEEMRFDPIELAESIDWSKMFLYSHTFNSKTVDQRIGLLLNVYDL
ncbi:MAG: hypothetical protein AAFY36_12465 [Bacteroidota bacterium]